MLHPTMLQDTGPTSWIPFEQGLNKVTRKTEFSLTANYLGKQL